MSNLYIGLMSGTSADGIDAVLVNFQKDTPAFMHHYYLPYDSSLREAILDLMQPGENEIERLGVLDQALGQAAAEAVNALLAEAKISKEEVTAIGSHGQTIRHYPYAKTPFTLQIGDPNMIAALTQITTIADFRRKDMALGGQGAPLVPRFHQAIFQTTHPRVIVNIGGIANITLLPAINTTIPIIGFDTGPGNALLDAWCMLNLQTSYDAEGTWAKSGEIDNTLLNALLSDPYFKLAPPKSTGRDYFQLKWLDTYLAQGDILSPNDVAATLTELTAQSIIDAILQAGITEAELILCGGGVHNRYLVDRLTTHCAPHFTIITSDKLGLHPNLVEAMAFAWLAKQTMNQQPGNLPSVTGAKQEVVLGGVYYSGVKP
jgi:anhydro-N-acetylmuramic acid kinase